MRLSIHIVESVTRVTHVSAPTTSGQPPAAHREPVSEPIHIAVDSFAADPHAWLDRVCTELGSERWELVLPTIAPATWRNGSGHSWRVVRTAEGIEIRPELESPFIRNGESPKVTALALDRTSVAVELTCRTGRWVDRFALGAFDVSALGHAMLDERPLPHDNLAMLFPSRR